MMLTWLSRKLNGKPGVAKRKARALFRPLLETLEDRLVPSALLTHDVFVSIGNGQVEEHNPATGALVQTLNNGFGGFTTGSAFDHAGNLYVTDFSVGKITEFSGTTGNIVKSFSTPGIFTPESIVFDRAGNFYVGGPRSTRIDEFNPAGTFVKSFTVAVETAGTHGTDWIDLAADQETLLYADEGRFVKQFDARTGTQKVDFNSSALPHSNAFALRLLSTGGMLVADSEQVIRLSPNGVVAQAYNVTNSFNLFALNLDPDGQTFWTADAGGNTFHRVNIQTGNTVSNFTATATFAEIFGLSVKGEITEATLGAQPLFNQPAIAPIIHYNLASNHIIASFLITNNNSNTFSGTFTLSFSSTTVVQDGTHALPFTTGSTIKPINSTFSATIGPHGSMEVTVEFTAGPLQANAMSAFVIPGFSVSIS